MTTTRSIPHTHESAATPFEEKTLEMTAENLLREHHRLSPTRPAPAVPAEFEYVDPARLHASAHPSRVAESALMRRRKMLNVRLESASPVLNALDEALLSRQVREISESLLFPGHGPAGYGNGTVADGAELAYAYRAEVGHGDAFAQRVIGVSSAVDGEGKTTIALQMALSLARNSCKRVCVADLSLGANDLAQRLGLPRVSDGVVNVLERSAANDEAGAVSTLPLHRLEGYDGLTLLPGGRKPFRAARAAHSPWLGDVFTALRERFDLIVVDLPSVASGNAAAIAARLDGVVLVVSAGVTPRAAVSDAVEHLGRHRILGTVLNGVESPLPRWLRRWVRQA